MKTINLIFLLALIQFQLGAQANNGLVAHYSFSNGKVLDLSGAGGEGTIYGSPKPVKGVKDEALYFDGGTHAVIFEGDINRYLEGTEDFSISFFFRSADRRQRQSLLSKRAECDNYRLMDIRSGHRLYAVLADSGKRNDYAKVYADIPDNKWHHYVFIRYAESAALFRNGRLIDARSSYYPVDLLSRSVLSINNSPCKGEDDTQNLKGAVDELKIYNRALGKSEVAQLYEKNKAAMKNANADKPSSGIDPRMDKIFGTYYDDSYDRSSTLNLKPKTFKLIVSKPSEFNGFDAAVLTGSYQIKAGTVYLYGKKLTLYQEDESFEESATEDPLVGDLYGNVSLDLYAFGNRLKLKKEN